MSTVIKVENVSKLYRLGEVGTGSLAHDVNRWWHKIRGNEDPYLKIGQVNDRTKTARSEVRGQKSEVRGQKSEIRGQKSEIRGQKADPSDTSSTDNRQPTTDNSSSPPSSLTSDNRQPTTDNSSSPPSSLTSDNRQPTTDNSSSPPSSDYVYALKDINFEVKQGEVLGIIGRNGAGKSTLLKILSRVTTPTTGQIKVKGRIASLLEVGTGFHPELTGRENIVLNGAILGMRKTEIARKFDEIVEFSGCERYIDTPVKRYSSGMYVRLAFAVAAHLEPEILIIDEVLAVGDAEFQKKCLGKMKDVAGEGRTVLFVSHNMAAVKTLCSRAVFLSDGKFISQGPTSEIVSTYLQAGRDSASVREWPDPATAPGNEHIRMEFIRVIPPGGESEITIDTGAEIEIGFHNAQADITLDCTVYLLNNDGLILFETGRMLSTDNDSLSGHYRVFGRLPPHLLNAGRYFISVLFGKDQYYPLFRMDEAVAFTVENTSTGKGHNMSVSPGIIRPVLQWRHESSEDDPQR